jgi:hypothetical protein
MKVNKYAKLFQEQSIILIVCILFIWLNRFATLAFYPKTTFLPDAADSLPTRLFEFNKVSLIGNAPRPFVTNIIYAMIPFDLLQLFQLVLSGIASTFLLISLHRIFRSTLAKNFAVSSVTILLASNTFLNWDNIANIQSITNSLLLFSLAVLILFFKTNTLKLLMCFQFLTILLVVQRPSFILFYFITNLILIKMIYTQKRNLLILVPIITFISGMIFCVVHTKNQDNHWPGNFSGLQISGFLLPVSPVSEEFKQYLKSKNAPECLLNDSRYSLFEGERFCSEALAWVEKDATQNFRQYLMSNPESAMKIVFYGLYGAFVGSSLNYGNSAALTPPIYEILVLGSRQPNSLTFFESSESIRYYTQIPIYSYSFILLVLAISQLKSIRSNPRLSALLKLGSILILLGFLTIISTSLAVYTEWTRVLFPFQILTYLGLCISFATIFDIKKSNSYSIKYAQNSK